MAQTVKVTLVDDLDGSEAEATLAFAIDGTGYEIDLSEKNSEALRDALDPYVNAARRVGKAPKGTGVKRGPYAVKKGIPATPTPTPNVNASGVRRLPDGKERNAKVRAWALNRGLPVAARGRIPEAVHEKFDAEYTG